MTTPTEDEARADVWDDAKIREAFIYDGGESAYYDPIHGEKEQRRIAGAIFDRWLEAHDAALLASRVSTPPSEHDHAGEARLWCETHQHTHVASMPRFTYQCKDCGWGQWYGDQAREHEFWTPENLRKAHTTYEVEHVMRPLPATPPTDEDEREALAVIVKQVSQKFGGPSMAEFANDPPIRKHYATADAILAAGFRRQVPSTPARRVFDVWEYGERNAVGGVWRIEPHDEPALWAHVPTERRVRRRKAGPWEPVSTEGEA